MAPEDIATELRARLAGRRDALSALGRPTTTSLIDAATSKTEEEPTECFWVRGDILSTRAVDVKKRGVAFRAEAEALALLNALARIDKDQVLAEMRALWPEAHRVFPTMNPSATSRQVIGCSRSIFAYEDYAGISERIVGVQRPTHKYLRDFEWLETALRSTGDLAVERWRPIPVRIAVYSRGADDLVFLLQEILKDIIVQHRTWQLQSTIDQEPKARAAASTRFRIVEVSLDRQLSTVPINVEALECLARITKFGIRLGRLPTIQEPNTSSGELLSVTESLRELIPAGHGNASTPSSIDYVFASNHTSARFIPALFSALQVNKTVKFVNLEVERRAFRADGGESIENARRMWQWTAYALFSRYADHGLKKVILDIEYLDDFAVEAMEEVLRSKNPFSILFQSDFGSQRWISASCFNLYHPRDAQDDDSTFIAGTPLCVRVIDQLGMGANQWWQVLLPGCGMAWVATSDATLPPTDESSGSDQIPSPHGPGPFGLHCDSFEDQKKDVVLRYLQLVPTSSTVSRWTQARISRKELT